MFLFYQNLPFSCASEPATRRGNANLIRTATEDTYSVFGDSDRLHAFTKVRRILADSDCWFRSQSVAIRYFDSEKGVTIINIFRKIWSFPERCVLFRAPRKKAITIKGHFDTYLSIILQLKNWSVRKICHFNKLSLR